MFKKIKIVYNYLFTNTNKIVGYRIKHSAKLSFSYEDVYFDYADIPLISKDPNKVHIIERSFEIERPAKSMSPTEFVFKYGTNLFEITENSIYDLQKDIHYVIAKMTWYKIETTNWKFYLIYKDGTTKEIDL